MKTSIKQLIERLEEAQSKCETLRDRIYFDGVLAIIEAGKFEELHEKEIHDAYKAGWNDESGPSLFENVFEYYDKTFEK